MMTDFLTRLAARALGLAPVVQPVIPPLYAGANPDIQDQAVEAMWPDSPPTPEARNRRLSPEIVVEQASVTDAQRHESDHVASPGPVPASSLEASSLGASSQPTPVVMPLLHQDAVSPFDIGAASERVSQGAKQNRLADSPVVMPLPLPQDTISPLDIGAASERAGQGIKRDRLTDSPAAPGRPVRPATVTPEPPQHRLAIDTVRAPVEPPEHLNPLRQQESTAPTAASGKRNTPLAPQRSAEWLASESPVPPTTMPRRVRPQATPYPERHERLAAAARAAAFATEDAPPTVRVTIGRIDVRAVTSTSSTPRPTPSRPSPSLALNDYLKQREGGRR